MGMAIMTFNVGLFIPENVFSLFVLFVIFKKSPFVERI